jgi:3-methylcrotonyl-CoA carboxylase alpha subunit
MFRKILIANRGEIACRVASTARRLNIATVAVFYDADRHARHVSMCDESYRLGPAPVSESYLRGDAIIAAALKLGAQAIHPGYGFLSENEDFAAAVHQAGLVFIGPPAGSIAAMGNKSAAKALMERAGVPLVPGYHGADQDAALLRSEAARIGYPVLIKASSGGGGKGMRIVTTDAEFDAALASCKREASASFGDDHVLIERYLQKPRHIEIQVFADQHKNCVYLFERDCSVQRRHQKVLEEAPAPNLAPETRHAMGKAAVAAARAVDYVGAGTVEFIANQDGTFFFMEMNTRLQVEHPVTEMVTGFDLVEWQLRVASGEALPVAQQDLRVHGHAIEARIYAENPDRDFLPATGQLDLLKFPPAIEFSLGDHEAPGGATAIRVDSGVREGDVISPYYDPMIAKLIVWGADRDAALARMRVALAGCEVAGVVTNLRFLGQLLDNPDFAAASLDTGLIERWRAQLLPPRADTTLTELAFLVASILDAERQVAGADPFTSLAAFRLNAAASRSFGFDIDGVIKNVTLSQQGAAASLLFEHDSVPFSWRAEDSNVWVTLDQHASAAVIRRAGDQIVVKCGAHSIAARLIDPLAQAGASEAEAGRLTAPMPGKIVALLVAAGSKVIRGQPLVVMEAMKMEHTIAAPADGTIKELLYAVGDQVGDGAQLLVLDVEKVAS